MKQNDNRLHNCIAITNHGKVYLYRNSESVTLVESSRNKNLEWDGFEEFCDVLNAKEMVDIS